LSASRVTSAMFHLGCVLMREALLHAHFFG
jgi:hypothetical protein